MMRYIFGKGETFSDCRAVPACNKKYDACAHTNGRS